ncbi:MAG: FAD-dependent oxidoreductase [Proteobacteria bacterium]|nr:FAD-dependent oxidoreductase [Pseudomonadota bacterium]
MKRSKPKIGVYVCHCGMNIAPKVDVEAVADFAERLESVDLARDYKFMCSNPGQELIVNDIREQNLDRVVVASCSPRMHEPTFRKACETAGIDPHCFQMANIREHSSWVTREPEKATAKAKDLVAAAVARVVFHRPLKTREVPVTKSVLIVGGGIAGIQAALSAAEAGFQVHLVERESSIGGHMAKFDKTFPTLDCAACISTPKTVSIGQHSNITLYSYSEVAKVEGFVGNYTVTVRRKPRYVLEDRCTGCGRCSEVCPVEIPSPFDEGLIKRKAIYRSFPQAIPLAFCIDKRDRAPCTRACPAEVNIQGYIQLIGQGEYEKALRLIMERIPLPGVLGRVCPNPCQSECRRDEMDHPLAIRELKRFAADRVDLSELPVPDITEKDRKVAIIGSGPAGLTVALDLRRMGYRATIFEALPVPGGMLRVGIPDYRLPQNVLDREIEFILDHGIEIRTNVSFGSDVTLRDLDQSGFSAVFIGIGAHGSVGMGIPGEDEAEGVLDALAFLREVNLGSRKRPGDKIVVIGGGNVAVDTAGVAKRLGSQEVSLLYRRSRKEMPAFDEEIQSVLEEGVRLSCLTAPVRIIEEKGKVAGLECLKTELGPEDASGRRRPIPIEGSEFVVACDAVVSAIGQKPLVPWADEEPGLEWTEHMTLRVGAETMQTSIPSVFAGGDVVRGPSTVIEAVADGHKSADAIHNYLQGNEEEIGKDAESLPDPSNGDWLEIPSQEDVRPKIVPARLVGGERSISFDEISLGYTEEQAAEEAAHCLNCGGCSECMECMDACEVSAIDHSMAEETVTVDAGALIVATGFKAFDPAPLVQYGYGRYPEVYTSLEFERLNNATGPTDGHILMKNGRAPERVAIIHCVGSRDSRNMEYCSRVCCMYSMKFAHLLREKTGAEVWEFYIDIRSPGKLYEEFYNRVQEEGVHFIRGRVAEVTNIPDDPADTNHLTVVAENTLSRRVCRIPVDMVVLSVGLQPADGSDDVGRLIGVSRDGTGWFNELHAKLAPVSTPIGGIFLAGCCQGPKDIPDTVAQAMAASGEAVALLSKGTVKTRAEISYIDPDLCVGCQTCVQVCPYSAIRFNPGLNVSEVNEALCQGCGSCAAACSNSAAGVRHFTERQIMEELEALF